MARVRVYLCLILLFVGSCTLSEGFDYFDQNDAVSNETVAAYSLGVHMGIINPEKYSMESFQQHEKDIFKDLYAQYNSLNISQPISYHEWLVMNNFGILSDTQESLFQKKTLSLRKSKDNKRSFLVTVKKGDILITTKGHGGLPGHAALMTTDYWVLDMPGGKGWDRGIRSNNRQLAKDKWYDQYSSEWTTVYRCPDNGVARNAAVWADYNYYSPDGLNTKSKHITYKITMDFTKVCPSYSSKLVLQAYYYGTGSKSVVREVVNAVVVPGSIPAYFLKPFTLVNKGKF